MSSLVGALAAGLTARLRPARRSGSPSGPAWLALPPSAIDQSPVAVLSAFASLPTEQALHHLQTTPLGLTEYEANARLAVKGVNILPTQRAPSWVMTLLGAIPNPFNFLLVFLAIISAAVPDQNWATVNVLFIMVIISILVRFWQEYRSSLAVFRLQGSITNVLQVRRSSLSTTRGSSGSTDESVMERDLVPGDIVLLSPGCIVPADCLIIDASFLRVSQSTWTGENEPVAKVPTPAGDKEASVFDMPNLAFMGTSVISGHGTAVVLRTGRDVLIASIASELTKKREPNAFQKGIRNVSWMLICFTFVMVPIVLGISGKVTGDWNEAAVTSISVAVGLVPEMLPAIVNANLARGAYALSQMKAVVKRLDSVQNIGAMSILCSDKTGTLTKDEIKLTQYLDYTGAENLAVLKLATIDAYIQGEISNNIDQALLAYRLPDEKRASLAQFEKLAVIPFTFERRRSACVVRGATGQILLICKGAFDEVLSLCASIRQDGVAVPLNAKKRQALEELSESLSKDGYRVLLVAEKQLPSFNPIDEDSLGGLETSMTLEGVLSFIDPPKEDAAQSIAQLKALGVEVKVLTGDSLPVALNVCQALGLVGTNDEIDDNAQAITGPQLAQLEGTPELDAAIKSCRVFAKLTPHQKALVVGSLRGTGQCVGMLGDGINDCIALRKADVGISVDSGASVAKDCADIILTEKGLGIIVSSVTTGRVTHGNTIKYIKMVASSNFGNVFSVMAASAWLPFQPMVGMQMLAQNLLYDISQIAIPWDRVDPEYLLTPKMWDTRDLLRFVLVLGPTSSVIDLLTFMLNWFYYGLQSTDKETVNKFRAHWFLQGLLTQTLIVHLLRTAKIPIFQGRSTMPLALATASIMTIGFSIPWIPPFREALEFAQPAPSFVGLLAAELMLYCLEVQAVKMIYVRVFKTWL